MVILRTTPNWSVRMTPCNFGSLTWEQQIKITFATWVRTNNTFQIIIMGHGGSLSYFILSCVCIKLFFGPGKQYVVLRNGQIMETTGSEIPHVLHFKVKQDMKVRVLK